jgi:superfamily II DNA or RNA helicase
MMPNYQMWDYQEKNLSEIIDFFDHGGRSVVLQQPTGTGKSRVAVEFVRHYREQSKPVYFITQSSNLLWQFSDTLTEYGLDHGIIKSGCATLRYRAQVISVQSLKKRVHMIEEPFAVIFEECHHAASAQFKMVLDIWPHVKILGLSATPGRPDGKPLDMFEKIIMSPNLRWFIDNCYLADYDYFIPAEFDTSHLHHLAGDFNKGELEKSAQDDSARVGNFVEHYVKYAAGLPGIAFGVSIADAENIARIFNEFGHEMKSMHSKTPDIDQVMKDAKAGKYNLLSTCDLIGEGTDIKRLTCMLDGRPTESIVVQVQHWGRPLRALFTDGYDLSTLSGRRAAMEAGGKGKAKILDFSSNYIRHGLPDDEREWSLTGGVKEKTASKYKRCPSCQRPIYNFLHICPYCGYEFPQTAPEPEETPERDGELIPISQLTYQDKNGLALRIAREAESLKDAVRIAKSVGVNQQAAWFVWRKLLKKEMK